MIKMEIKRWNIEEKEKEYLNKLQKNMKVYRIILEYLYLVLLAMVLYYYFMTTTMFEVVWPDNFIDNMSLYLIIVIVARCVCAKHISQRKIALMLAIMLVFSRASQISGYSLIYMTALLIIGTVDIDYKKIVKTYLIVTVPMTIWTIISSQLGTVENLIYNQQGRIREAFGFVYPTDFAAHVFFVMVAWVLLRQVKCTYFELLCMILITIALDNKCDTRCSELSILLVVGSVIILKFKEKHNNKIRLSRGLSCCIQICALLIPFVIAGTMIFLSRFYNPDSYWMDKLNSFINQRLNQGKIAFDDYNTTLWGQYVHMVGNGRSVETPVDYFYIDCSYVNILMRYGLLVFIVLFIILEVVMLKNIQSGCITMLLLVVCIHSAIEHHLFECYYNVFMLLPLAVFHKNTKETGKKDD